MRFGSLGPAGLLLAALFGAWVPCPLAAQGRSEPSPLVRHDVDDVDDAGIVAPTSSEAADAPPRYVATASVGVPLRVTRRVDFDQRLVAPLYADVLAGYVLSSERRVRHGVGLGLSLNLTPDGGYTEPIDGAGQIVVMPSYLVYAALDDTWLLLGHVGVPILASGGRSIGLEVGAGVGYRWLAGAGVFAEAGVDGFTGGDSTLHVTASLELGVFVDYEVLP